MTDKTELEALKAEVQALKDRLDPPPRPPSTWQKPDPTEGMSMPANAMKAMVDVLPSSFFADLRADARKPNPMQASSSMTTSAQSQPTQRGTGWVEPRPLESPPGVTIADHLMDAQDRLDQIELARKMAAAEVALKAAKENK